MVSAMTDDEMEELENQFPAKAGVAFAAARRRVLASGQSILESENGVIFEQHPDGRRVPVKHIEPPIPIVAGTVFHLQ